MILNLTSSKIFYELNKTNNDLISLYLDRSRLQNRISLRDKCTNCRSVVVGSPKYTMCTVTLTVNRSHMEMSRLFSGKYLK